MENGPNEVSKQKTQKVIYLSAINEEDFVIAQANAAIDEKGKFKDQLISCRKNGEFINTDIDSIDLMDVSPQQLVSVAAALIPFLEHDDANRALMGSNMQPHAVPLVRAEAPFVGTGMEGTVARDSGAAIVWQLPARTLRNGCIPTSQRKHWGE